MTLLSATWIYLKLPYQTRILSDKYEEVLVDADEDEHLGLHGTRAICDEPIGPPLVFTVFVWTELGRDVGKGLSGNVPE